MTDFKNRRRSATSMVPFAYPVELVWQTLASSKKGGAVQQMEIDEWENAVPGKGEVYTRPIEAKTNKLLSFKMKTQVCETVWKIEFEKVSVSTTNVTFSVDIVYTGDKAVRHMLFARSPMAEIKGVASDMKFKLRMDDEERKRRMDEFYVKRH